jgi:NAD(P)-dependent dehydrogenase (short-subunit alcohol dehydrogenase family)
MAGRVEGKVAIVTGAARGIGRTHCLSLAKEGADIVAVDITRPVNLAAYKMGDEQELNGVVLEVKALGRRAIALKCDVSKADEVKKMFEDSFMEFGRIDILVNNVGVVRVGVQLTEMPEDVWDMLINVNLKSQFLCCKYVAPYMIRQGYGKIVNIGSIAGRLESATSAAYGVSKAGVHALTRVFAGELAAYKINVNCVAPGSIKNTGMRLDSDHVYAKKMGVEEDNAYKLMYETMHLMKREILPEDVSNAVVFLASDEARNIDGMVIYVDGGHP